MGGIGGLELPKHCILIGAPVETGQRHPGCVMGPLAYRVAGLPAALCELGHSIEDWGDARPVALASPLPPNPNPRIHSEAATVAWTLGLADAAERAMGQGFPIFLGGDHSMSMGTIAGIARHADKANRQLFVLWLDAHSDFHVPQTTDSGSFHGMPVAYISGCDGFDAFPAFPKPIAPANLCLFGIRSVDAAEHSALQKRRMTVNDMRVLDERGIVAPLREFLHRVADANGLLHVSLDVDFLDPTIAPAVGTTVPGGATFREAHLVMELLHEHDLVTSLDLAELNPFLDERGRTARLMVDLAASLMGRKVFDRMTRSLG